MNSNDVLALAATGCTLCNGLGTRDKLEACGCVERQVFRIVMAKVRQIATGEHLLRPVTLGALARPQGRRPTPRREESFVADIWLIACRVLSPRANQLFRFHYLLGADSKLCCQRLRMDRGAFFHEAYRVEKQLGRAFRTMKPFPLFPLDEYFSITAYGVDVRPFPIPEPKHPNGVPLRPPLAPRPTKVVIIKPPAPVLSQPQPEPVAVPLPSIPVVVPVRARTSPFNISDIAEVAAYSRKLFRAGRSLYVIAGELTKWKACGSESPLWKVSEVKRLLLDHPRLKRGVTVYQKPTARTGILAVKIFDIQRAF